MSSDRANDVLTVIGIDCATKPRNTGIALGVYAHDGHRVEQVDLGRPAKSGGIVEQVADLIGDAHTTSTLIALDAPLGWPQALGEALQGHRAGTVPQCDADRMFHRRTDDVVEKRVGQKPFEVGAAWIARTAHAALRFLAELRQHTGLEVPLAWTPGQVSDRVEAIEVYPAATLIGHGLPSQGYKKGSEARLVRERLATELARIVDFDPQVDDQDLIDSDDLLDAVACVVAGVDFVAGDVIPPTDKEREQAEREGWIWFKPPQ